MYIKRHAEEVIEKATKQTKTERPEAERAFDARNYTLTIMAHRLEQGETSAAVLKDFADILKTDEQRSPEKIPDSEIIYLANELYKRTQKR